MFELCFKEETLGNNAMDFHHLKVDFPVTQFNRIYVMTFINNFILDVDEINFIVDVDETSKKSQKSILEASVTYKVEVVHL